MDKKIYILIAVVILIGGCFWFFDRDEDPFKGAFDAKCNVTQSVATIGDDISSEILAASGVRAWAVIQQPISATNTPSLSFDEGAAAVAGQGYTLDDVSSSTDETPRFGRNAFFAYTGAVTGITNNGSTTVNVIECNY